MSNNVSPIWKWMGCILDENYALHSFKRENLHNCISKYNKMLHVITYIFTFKASDFSWQNIKNAYVTWYQMESNLTCNHFNCKPITLVHIFQKVYTRSFIWFFHKFSNSTSILAKFASFNSDSNKPDVDRFWMQLDYKF